MDIYIYPAIAALVASALTGWFHKKERTSIVFAVIAFIAICWTIDPYRVRALQSSVVCIQDTGCTSTGLQLWIVPLLVGFVVCVLVGLVFAGLAKWVVSRTNPTIGSHDKFEFDPIIWPPRPR